MDTFRHWRALIVVHRVEGVQVHDARLVATIISYKLDAILTFDAHFKRFPITVLEPDKV